MPSPRPSNGGTAVTKAVTQLTPLQRNVLFGLGAVAFLLPVVDHLAEVVRGVGLDPTILHVISDGVFLFAGVLGMIPAIALRIADKLLVWKRQ